MNVHMSDEHILTLRQADQARYDFAAISSDLEFIAGQLANVPARAYLCRMLLLAVGLAWLRVIARSCRLPYTHASN